jgi:Peptidase S46
MGTIKKKEDFENKLSTWIAADNNRMIKYGNILPKYKELYTGLREYILVNSYTNEVFFNSGAELVSFARNLKALAELIKNKGGEDQINILKINLIETGRTFFQNYNQATDKKLFVAVMTIYGENLDLKWQAPEYVKLKNSCKGNFSSIVNKLYAKSVFSDEERYKTFVTGLNSSGMGKLNKDPFYLLALNVTDFMASNVRPELGHLNDEIQKLNRDYMSTQMEFDKERIFYPDANSTLRLTYGAIKGYYSKDAVYFTFYTTLKGIIEKDNPEIYDYDVPEKMRQLYKTKDYGRYTQNGEVPVCFIANNHTTGGNSGSPVINSEGQLIGVNFDRAWEGVASDLSFNPDQSRNISLDIRYALFIIDKFAGADYLLKEMTIVE